MRALVVIVAIVVLLVFIAVLTGDGEPMEFRSTTGQVEDINAGFSTEGMQNPIDD